MRCLITTLSSTTRVLCDNINCWSFMLTLYVMVYYTYIYIYTYSGIHKRVIVMCVICTVLNFITMRRPKPSLVLSSLLKPYNRWLIACGCQSPVSMKETGLTYWFLLKVDFVIVIMRVYSRNHAQLPLLLTGFNFNASMDKQLHPLQSVVWNYLYILKLQRLHRWS